MLWLTIVYTMYLPSGIANSLTFLQSSDDFTRFKKLIDNNDVNGFGDFIRKKNLKFDLSVAVHRNAYISLFSKPTLIKKLFELGVSESFRTHNFLLFLLYNHIRDLSNTFFKNNLYFMEDQFTQIIQFLVASLNPKLQFLEKIILYDDHITPDLTLFAYAITKLPDIPNTSNYRPLFAAIHVIISNSESSFDNHLLFIGRAIAFNHCDISLSSLFVMRNLEHYQREQVISLVKHANYCKSTIETFINENQDYFRIEPSAPPQWRRKFLSKSPVRLPYKVYDPSEGQEALTNDSDDSDTSTSTGTRRGRSRTIQGRMRNERSRSKSLTNGANLDTTSTKSTVEQPDTQPDRQLGRQPVQKGMASAATATQRKSSGEESKDVATSKEIENSNPQECCVCLENCMASNQATCCGPFGVCNTCIEENKVDFQKYKSGSVYCLNPLCKKHPKSEKQI
eukprot:NODE_260_length_11481_cov_1.187928.p2 type:complete len:452 gc:universal NODE_260_length_11481_cov_1.187928:5595-6950(+)